MLAPACYLHLHRTDWLHSGVWFLPTDRQGSLCVLLPLCKHHLAVSDSSLDLDPDWAPSGPHSAPVPWLISFVLSFSHNFLFSVFALIYLSISCALYIVGCLQKGTGQSKIAKVIL